MYELFGLFLLGPNGQFSQDMYMNGFYNPIAFFMFIAVAVCVILFYIVINHARWSKSGVWMIWGLVFSFFIALYAWMRANDQLLNLYNKMGQTMPYSSTELFPFSVIVFLWSLFFFLLLSFIVKRFSVNCRHTPWISKWPKH